MKGWKTLAFAAVISALGAIQGGLGDVGLDAQTEGVVLATIGGIVAVLRVVTTGPVGKGR